MSEEMILITKKRFDELESDSRFLECLFSAGVDDWEGYEIAQDMMEE